MVRRIYTEKKEDFAVEARLLLEEIRDFLKINSLTGLRLINRYDVEGLDSQTWERSIPLIFAQPNVSFAYREFPPVEGKTLLLEMLPEQFDQRAVAAAQCLQFLAGGERPRVRTAQIYVLEGEITAEEEEAIRDYLLNPVESWEGDWAKPKTLAPPSPRPADVGLIEGFLTLDGEGLKEVAAAQGLTMDLGDLTLCQDYFAREGREPTVTEIRLIDTYWSDHCRHTTFSTQLEEVDIADGASKRGYERYLALREELGQTGPITLMDLATIGARYLKAQGLLANLYDSPEINAYTVEIKVDVDGREEDWLLLFKNETHNHPTEIEPFGGANTCVGGAIRDPLSGRAYVYQAMRVGGASDPTVPAAELIPGKLHPRVLGVRSAAGSSAYGNQIGLAMGLVREIYHPGYRAKRMELGALVGAVAKENVKSEEPQPGDVVVLLGGRTGRDGIGAAAGSSRAHTTSSLAQGGSEVQRGNPLEERKLVRFFRRPEVTAMIKRANDFGAGGVAVAIGELAPGVKVDLDRVPVKYPGLDGTELALSESQERMAVVIAAKDGAEFLALAREENLEATVVAEITEEPRLKMTWRGKNIVDISRDFLASNGAPKYARVKVEEFPPLRDGGEGPYNTSSLEGCLRDLVQDLNICSQRGLREGFDATAGGGTLLNPLGGRRQRTPAQVMAAKIPLLKGETETCTLMSFGFNPFLSSRNQYAGGYLSVLESVAKIVAAGGDLSQCYLSFQEYFARLGDDPRRWGQPFASLLGALAAQLDLGLASIGGKDSMSGSFEDLDVPPTLISFAVAVGKAGHIISPEFKRAGSRVYLLSPPVGAEGLPRGEGLGDYFAAVARLLRERRVASAFTPTFGGVLAAIFKMCLGNGLGFALTPDLSLSQAVAPNYASFLVEEGDGGLGLEEELAGWGNVCLLGRTLADYVICRGQERVDLEVMEGLYEKPLAGVFPVETPPGAEEGETLSFRGKASGGAGVGRLGARPSPKVKPRVLIPVFPGTNGEYEAQRAFTVAGAKVEPLLIRDLTPRDLEESAEALVRGMKGAQILLLPAGSAGGDEPHGAAKLISSFFWRPEIVEALGNFLEKGDTLLAGLGNGFQALLRLGLLPFGEIRAMEEDWPSLTTNKIGRFRAKLVRCRVVSTLSPWLSHCQVGDIQTVAFANGQGRFMCNAKTFKTLVSRGQIATQYVDLAGEASMDSQYNPAGSYYAIEGITAPDGRIFGRMGHGERMGPGLYRNVCTEDGAWGMFAAALTYFR